MVFDKNQYRLREFKRQLANAHSPAEQARLEKRIGKLKARGPEYYIKFRNALGRKVTERVPSEYRGRRGAERFHSLRVGEVEKGDHNPRKAITATIEAVCNHYLDRKMRFRKSHSAAKTLVGHITRHMGNASLQSLDRNPQIIVDHFADFPEDWAPKYIYNYFLCLRAAINYWIKMQRLHLANPLDLVEIEPNTNVNDYVPTRADFDAIYLTSLTLGLPDFVRHLYTAVYETGLRIGEILGWRIEEMDLAPPEFDDKGRPVRLPFFTTLISKQGKTVKTTIPMSKGLHMALLAQVGDRSYGKVWEVEQSKLYKLLREGGLLKEAGVPFTRPFHDFRKTVKRRLKIEMGLGRDISKGFMGHKTDAMDDYYTHLKMFDLWSAVEDSWKPAE